MDGIVTRRCDNQALFYFAVGATIPLGVTSVMNILSGSTSKWVTWNDKSEDEPKQEIGFGLFTGCRGALCDDLDLDTLYSGENAHGLRASGAFWVLSMFSSAAALLLSVLMLLKITKLKKYSFIPGWKKLGIGSQIAYFCTWISIIIYLIVFELEVYRKYFDYDFLRRGVSSQVGVYSLMFIVPSQVVQFIFIMKYNPDIPAPGSTYLQTFSHLRVRAEVNHQPQGTALDHQQQQQHQQQQNHQQQRQQGQTLGLYLQQRPEQK